jgi:hypothetical protein
MQRGDVRDNLRFVDLLLELGIAPALTDEGWMPKPCEMKSNLETKNEVIGGFHPGQAPPIVGRTAQVVLRLVGPTAAGHGAFDGNRNKGRGILFQGIAAKDDEIGELPSRDGAFDFFFGGGVGAVDSAHADGLVHANALVGAPDVAFGVRAGDFGLQGHHGFEGTRGVVGSLGGGNTRIEKAAKSEHMFQTLGAVEMHFFPVVVDIARKRRGNGAESLDAGNKRVVH